MSLIRNRNQVKQVIDFTGVQNGKLHPSDVDFVLEFDNKVLILGEVKESIIEYPQDRNLYSRELLMRGEKEVLLSRLSTSTMMTILTSHWTSV